MREKESHRHKIIEGCRRTVGMTVSLWSLPNTMILLNSPCVKKCLHSCLQVRRMGENTHSARHVSRFSVKIWTDGKREKAVSLLKKSRRILLILCINLSAKLLPQKYYPSSSFCVTRTRNTNQKKLFIINFSINDSSCILLLQQDSNYDKFIIILFY